MSPKSAQRFWDNDMRKTNNLKRIARIRFYATRFRDYPAHGQMATRTGPRKSRMASVTWLGPAHSGIAVYRITLA
jgi:hypothetical protein